MHLLYVITALSSQGGGEGGHYHSLLTIAEALNERIDEFSVSILVLGDLIPPIFKKTKLPIQFVKFNKIWPFSYLGDIRKVVSERVPTHVHAYDNKSYFFARCIARWFGAKRYLTRPGGPNPKLFFPYCEDLVLFSKEGLSHFEGKKKFYNSRLHYVPNRVLPIQADSERIEKLKEKHKIDGPILLRIARIGGYHRKTIEQTFSLAQKARDEGVSVRAMVIGYVEDETVLESLKTVIGKEDVIETDPYFTVKAAALIPIADYVVGTGRALMEAAMFGKVLFVPTSSTSLPTLVSLHNWRDLAVNNFSERSFVEGVDDENACKDAINLFVSENIYSQCVDVSQNEIGKEYNVYNALDVYVKIYNNEQSSQISFLREIVDCVLNTVVVIRSYWSLFFYNHVA